MTIAIYRVTRNIKHKEHGWLILGRFVKCRPEYAKNYVIRRELVRVSPLKQASVKALWIDVFDEPKKQKAVSEPKAKSAQVAKAQRAQVKSKVVNDEEANLNAKKY